VVIEEQNLYKESGMNNQCIQINPEDNVNHALNQQLINTNHRRKVMLSLVNIINYGGCRASIFILLL